MANMLYKATKYMNKRPFHDSPKGQTEEKGEARWSPLGQRKKVHQDEWSKGR